MYRRLVAAAAASAATAVVVVMMVVATSATPSARRVHRSQLVVGGSVYVEYSDLKQKVFARKRVVEVDRNGFRRYLHYLGVDAVAVGIDERHDSSGEEPLFVERTVGGEDIDR